MSEIAVSQTQVEDSFAALQSAVDTTFGPQEAGYYRPDTARVPRPEFALFASALEAYADARAVGLENYGGRVVIGPQHAEVVRNFAGLRGVARGRVQGSNGVEVLQGPFIVLEGGDRVAVLTAEVPADSITEMQHSFLTIEYEKASAQVSSEHNAHDVVNAGETAPALVVVTSLETGSAHQDLHGLAPRAENNSFAANFSNQGRQDIHIGHNTRRVRSAILPITSVQMYIGSSDQLPKEAELLGLGLSDSELAVGITLAATHSRGARPDLKANLSSMVGE